MTVSTPARHDAALAFAEVAEVYRADGFPRMVQAVEAHLNPAAVEIAAMDEATYTLYSTLAKLCPDPERPRLSMDEISNLFRP